MPKTILIVEDYADARRLMRLWLEMSGHQVVEAADGHEAVKCVKTKCPDLILMDIGLPVMDGIVATRRIRQLDEGKHVPVIVMTAFQREVHERALKAGCNQVISKPIDHESVLQIISGYLQI